MVEASSRTDLRRRFFTMKSHVLGQTSGDATVIRDFVGPVYGYPALSEEPQPDDGGGSYIIRWRCDFEFGVTDSNLGYSYADCRQR